MRKTFLFSTALFIAAAAVYLYKTVQIFTPAKVTAQLSDIYLPKPTPYLNKLRCYKSTQTVAPLNKPQIQVLVWNIHKGDDQGWQKALQQFGAQADLLLLQEVTNQQNIATWLNFPVSLYVTAFSYHQRTSGVNLLAHFAPSSYCAASEQEPWLRIPKVAVAAQFPLNNGQSLLVVNLHLVNFEWTPTNYRKQVEAMINLVAQHQGPILLAGDFNTWNAERSRLIKRLMTRHRLQEVVFTPDQRKTFWGYPLDHIFVRGLTLIYAAAQPTEASDHNPLLATFALEGNR